jgi:hypothetical protein
MSEINFLCARYSIAAAYLDYDSSSTELHECQLGLNVDHTQDLIQRRPTKYRFSCLQHTLPAFCAGYYSCCDFKLMNVGPCANASCSLHDLQFAMTKKEAEDPTLTLSE